MEKDYVYLLVQCRDCPDPVGLIPGPLLQLRVGDELYQ